MNGGEGASEGGFSRDLALAGTLHDIKNRAQAIIANTHRLRGAGIDRPELDALEHQAARLGEELTRVLSVFRLRQADYPLLLDEHPVDIWLNEVASEPAEEGQSNVQIEVRCAEGLAHLFDEHLLTSVMRAALDNALRFARAHIVIEAGMTGEQELKLSIEDDGEGFTEDAAAGIDGSRWRTGLGLLLAEAVASVHSNGERTGSVSVGAGRELGGARFEICIP